MNPSKSSFVFSTIAGVLIAAQIVLLFFFSVPGIPALRIAGYCLWGLCALLVVLPIITFKLYGKVPQGKNYMHTGVLVTRGIYGIVRHPQFLCMPLLPVAAALLSQHWLVITVGAPALVLGVISLRGADKGNIEKFGDDYREYMKRVPGYNLFAGIWRRITRKTPAGRPL